MRNFLSGVAVLLLATLVFTACQNSSTTTTTSNTAVPPKVQSPGMAADGVKRISVEDAQAALAKGTAVIVDVRDAASYKSSHIAGSLNIPAAEMLTRFKELPTDKQAILYCS